VTSTVTGMSDLFSSQFTPDPTDALDVLAFILCPLAAFAPSGDEAEIEAVAALIAPAKAEAVRRWHASYLISKQN
jgi:hypothetical protein